MVPFMITQCRLFATRASNQEASQAAIGWLSGGLHAWDNGMLLVFFVLC
jgi:hypothetical protein